MTTYRTRTRQVTAVQWRGDNEGEITDFFPDAQFVWEGDSVIVHDPTVGYLPLEKYHWAVRSVGTGFVTIYDPRMFDGAFELDDGAPSEPSNVLHVEMLPGPEAALPDWVNKAGWAQYLIQTVRCGNGHILCLFSLPVEVAAARARGELIA